tara:strand:- start:1747 stop:2475 length:729 start_codon:yes stop_codon:yes gene_type:complete
MTDTNIAILLSLCSRNMKWNTIGDMDLFKIFLPNFFNTVSNKYNYKLIIGYDDDDKFIINNLDKIKKRIGIISKFIELKDCQHKPCKAWNTLLKESIDDADYFYQIGSDSAIETNNWDSYFVSILKKNNNIGICSGVDTIFYIDRILAGQNGIAENVFFHKTHYKIFNTLFHPSFKNFFSDDYITKLYYSINKCFICPYITFKNKHRVKQQNSNRYIADDKNNTWQNVTQKDIIKLKKFYTK